MAGIEVLAEGYDEKSVGYVIMARPTMSKALSQQSVGRGLTRGEAAHLIEECDRPDERYPTPATPGQERLLRSQGQWQSGLSKRAATRLIAGLMRRAADQQRRARNQGPGTWSPALFVSQFGGNSHGREIRPINSTWSLAPSPRTQPSTPWPADGSEGCP
jgi:hypothetical protein